MKVLVDGVRASGGIGAPRDDLGLASPTEVEAVEKPFLPGAALVGFWTGLTTSKCS